MKGKITAAVLIALLISGGALIANAKISDKDPSNSEIKTNKVDIISKEEAKNAVLKEVSGKTESIELEKESGKAFYEIEVEDEAYEYEFYVDARTGETFLIEKEARDDGQDDDYDDDIDGDDYD